MVKKISFLILGLWFWMVLLAEPAFAEVKFKWGPYFRLRHEYWKNIKDMDNDTKDARNFFRVKSSLWGQADFNENTGLFAKLTNEFKAYTYFAGTTSSLPDKSSSKKGYHFDMNEIVFDSLYADIRNFAGAPVDLRIGRQDFLGTYGEGFLIMDGTPQDGSRTFYFNAAKAIWRMDDKNTLDFVYINDPRDEEFLPVINRKMFVSAASPNSDKIPQILNTTDEQGYVLYWKNKGVKNLNLEGYYIFKKEDEEGGVGLQSQESRINTFGTFAKYDFAPWALRGQVAIQTGDYGDIDRQAEGGYVYLDRNFDKFVWSPKTSVGFIYLSGDNPKTADKDEAWDPLFSRYPWISELYTTSIASDSNNKISNYWTNLEAVRVELALQPIQKTKLTLRYNYLWAADNVPASTTCTGDSKGRGHLPQARLDYAFNKNVTAYFLAEYFVPGSFYTTSSEAVFLRTELQIKF